MRVLVAGEVIGRGGGAVVAIVAVVAAVVVVVVVVGVAAVVGGGRRDCIEVGWYGETRGGTVEVEGVEVGGPTFEIGEGSRMEKFVDRGRNRKKRWKSGVVAGQGA